MENPEISIIVPVYNVEKYIRRCLDSITAQTFTDWECICVDDGTPDASGKICDEYAQKDSRFVVIHKENGGVSSARNVGLDMAKGEWICFADGDDWIEMDCFEKVQREMCNEECDLIQWGVEKDDINGKYIMEEKFPAGTYLFEENTSQFCPGVYNKLIKREIIENNKIRFPEGIKLSEDRYFSFLCYVCSKKIKSLDYVFYHYIQNNNSVTHNITASHIMDEIKVIQMMEEYVYKTISESNSYNQFLVSQKLICKGHILYLMNNPDFDLWRKTFPEIDNDIINMKNRLRIINLLVLGKNDFVARLLVAIVKRLKR